MSNSVLINPKKTPNPVTRMYVAACIAGLAIGGACGVLVQPVHAAPSEEVRTKVVRYGDLNLGTLQGRQVLDQRLRRAARQVCDVSGGVSALQRRAIRQCQHLAHSNAWATAEKRVGHRLAISMQH